VDQELAEAAVYAPGRCCCVCTHQMATIFLWEMTSWPPSWTYGIISKIGLRQSMRILVEEQSCQISSRSDLKWWSLTLLWRVSPNMKKNKMSTDTRSVPDPKALIKVLK